MIKKVDVVIIGAGSAGLSALRRVKEHTDNYAIIDHHPLGTKCARTGCMPSKAVILAANDFYRRRFYAQQGIRNSDKLSVDIPALLSHVRLLRDHFTDEMIKVTKKIAGDRLISGCAKITAADCIQVEGTKIKTDKIIIAVGSRPKIPEKWKKFGSRILTSDNIFEQRDLPKRVAVIGLGPIGLELGQALSRLGLEVTGFDLNSSIAKITDPKVGEEALKIFGNEFPLYLGDAADIGEQNGSLIIKHPKTELAADAVLAAIGAESVTRDLGLENLGMDLDKNGMPDFNEQTMQVASLPVFIAGDATGRFQILHEALDEGFAAGNNSCSQEIHPYCRRTPLHIVFSDPQIAAAGVKYKQLNGKRPFVIGQANFAGQSRAVLELRNQGLLRIYVDKETTNLLGGELVCPDAEHLAHHIAAAIQRKLTVFDMLQMPFYHPAIEESLRTALQDAASRLPGNIAHSGLSLCESSPEKPLR